MVSSANSTEEHLAAHIEHAIDLAQGAKTDLTMLRTEIDGDRSSLLELVQLHRDALKAALRHEIKRSMRSDGHSFPGFHMRSAHPKLVALAQEVCREMDLDAEHAG